jgi:hypothetical protein
MAQSACDSNSELNVARQQAASAAQPSVEQRVYRIEQAIREIEGRLIGTISSRRARHDDNFRARHTNYSQQSHLVSLRRIVPDRSALRRVAIALTPAIFERAQPAGRHTVRLLHVLAEPEQVLNRGQRADARDRSQSGTIEKLREALPIGECGGRPSSAERFAFTVASWHLLQIGRWRPICRQREVGCGERRVPFLR